MNNLEQTTQLVDNVPALEEKLSRVRKAQQKFATYTQEQVDRIFLAVATAANQARIPLAKMAVAETGMGIVEDKVIKNHFAAEYIYNAYKDTKTCGVIEGQSRRYEKNCRAAGRSGCGYSYHKPNLYCNF